MKEKLVACAQIKEIQSIYTWKDQVCEEAEFQITAKINLEEFERVESRIKSLHSYDVPEIIAFPIAKGHLPYLKWMQAETTTK